MVYIHEALVFLNLTPCKILAEIGKKEEGRRKKLGSR
jgi:hypothetical protein